MRMCIVTPIAMMIRIIRSRKLETIMMVENVIVTHNNVIDSIFTVSGIPLPSW